MKNKTIRQRLTYCLIGLTLVSVSQFAMSSLMKYDLRSTISAQRVMGEVRVQQMYGDMKHDAVQADIFRLRMVVDAGKPALVQQERAHLAKDIEELDSTYRKVEGNRFEPELQQLVDRAHAARKDYIARAGVVAAAIAGGRDAGAEMADFTRSFDAFEKVQDDLGQAIHAEMANAQNSADSNNFIAFLIDCAAVIGGVLVLAYSAFTVHRRVIVPLGDMARALRQMAAGDYATPLPSTGAQDEIAEIASAAMVFQSDARARQAAERDQHAVVEQLSSGLQHLARKDLEYRIRDAFPQPYDELRRNYNQAVSELADTIAATRVGALGVTTSVTEIRNASDDLALRNENQANSVSAMHLEASQGGEVVNQAVHAMEELEQTATEIAQINSVIDGIAFQTNLLALNAGVEAARAGEAGKGFAVVANEVRALAQRTSEAASQIKSLIERSNGQVTVGVGYVRETGQMLARILRQFSEINSTIQQNAAMAEQTTAATRSLESEAERLGQLVRTFRTRDVDARPSTTPIAPQLRRNSLGEPESFASWAAQTSAALA